MVMVSWSPGPLRYGVFLSTFTDIMYLFCLSCLKLKPQNLNTEIHGRQLPYIMPEMKSLEAQPRGLAWVQRTFNLAPQ